MADVVAIVSVATSGAVGLAGIISTVWSSAAARRWQGREERVVELRTVLDRAAEVMASSMEAIRSAHGNLLHAREGAQAERAQIAADLLGDALRDVGELTTLSNRVRVRRGADARVAAALASAERAIKRLWDLVKVEMATLKIGDTYSELVDVAQSAAAEFFDAAADELRADTRHPG